MRERFTKLARAVADVAGGPFAFVAALCLVLIWAATGPFFNWSDSHSLIINTITTVVTFLMVFLIQSSQNRDTRALHAKLDELLCSAEAADNKLIDIEHDSDEALEAAREGVAARKDLG